MTLEKIWGYKEGLCAWCLDKKATKEYEAINPLIWARLCIKSAIVAMKRGYKRMTICKECEGDGCSVCTVFCGDCLTPIENCGCSDE